MCTTVHEKPSGFGLESDGAVVTIGVRSKHGQTGRMRYQIARVTLGAFFCVASAMSQEPATSTETLLQLGSAQSGSSGGSSHSEETSYFENTLTPKF